MNRRRIPRGVRYDPVPRPSWQPTGRALSAIERAVVGFMLARWTEGEDVVVVSLPGLGASIGCSARAALAAVSLLLAPPALLERVKSGGGRGVATSYRLTSLVLGETTHAPRGMRIETTHEPRGMDDETAHAVQGIDRQNRAPPPPETAHQVRAPEKRSRAHARGPDLAAVRADARPLDIAVGSDVW